VDANYAFAEDELADALLNLGRSAEARRAGEEALAAADRVVAQRPQYGWAMFGKFEAEMALSETTLYELDPTEALRLAMQETQTTLAMVKVEPNNSFYTNEVGLAYGDISDSMWAAGRLREGIGYARKMMQFLGQAGASEIPVYNLVTAMGFTLQMQALSGDSSAEISPTVAAAAALSPDVLRKLGHLGSIAEQTVLALRAYAAAAAAYEHNDFGSARQLAHSALAALQAGGAHGRVDVGLMDAARCPLSDIEGRAEYQLGNFAAAAQAERTALQACKAGLGDHAAPRRIAQHSTWLSMALAHEAKSQEAAQTIAPVVAMYRALEKKNHGDRWLPLELAEALYAQSLTDDGHRAALLREATGHVDHLIPSIAGLHDTRQWRARIEAARRRVATAE
jgi:tetratricopeptide (TPR) repeat protein